MSEQNSTLLRGKACIICRRRKMKCDGARPHCSQCIKSKKAMDCEYTDNQGRPRIEVLEENIALLQARIFELENPQSSDRNVLLQNPYTALSDGGAGSSEDRANISQWWELEEPPLRIQYFLIDIFVPFAANLGFVISIERFRERLNLTSGHHLRPHLALINAISLWASHISEIPDLRQHTNIFLQRAILQLQSATNVTSRNEVEPASYRYIDAMQAEVLLTHYLLSLGRNLEGRYHANAAVSLAVGCGLYEIEARYLSPSPSPMRLSVFPSFRFTPPQDSTELGEHIRIFWSIFILDRCWSAALGEPCILIDDVQVGTSISTPWPLDLEAYLTTNLPPSSLQHVQEFFLGNSTEIEAISPLADRARVSALFERANRLSLDWSGADQSSKAQISNEARRLVGIISQFVRVLGPVDQIGLSGNVLSQTKQQSTLIIHGLAHAAMIFLIKIRLSASPILDHNVINIGLGHCSEISEILEKLSSTEQSFIDPISSIFGIIAANFINSERGRLSSLGFTMDILEKTETTEIPIFRMQAEQLEVSYANPQSF
ncbi:hypothetical protein PNOK_0839600 [Pyrrhoderma noxium]|uniref:Zn(2)-C6 fungal-type domain-containing protein n=1 Tax=Pyrrhoderma noxium TaxID=2282107 RepID=A0A286UB52_9AGAM|nr:hypothetical protein PNOK_0839600 [Pyrrhoderma noxium]